MHPYRRPACTVRTAAPISAVMDRSGPGMPETALPPYFQIAARQYFVRHHVAVPVRMPLLRRRGTGDDDREYENDPAIPSPESHAEGKGNAPPGKTPGMAGKASQRVRRTRDMAGKTDICSKKWISPPQGRCFLSMGKGGYLSCEDAALLMNTVIKRPLPGLVDSVALKEAT